jgi:hypothetical protein
VQTFFRRRKDPAALCPESAETLCGGRKPTAAERADLLEYLRWPFEAKMFKKLQYLHPFPDAESIFVGSFRHLTETRGT